MKKIVIKGIIENSLLDWEGKIVSTLYVPHCDFRCPYCQNAGMVLNPDQYETIPWQTIKDFLLRQKGWLDGICLTGGEPCLFDDLPEFIRKVRDLGFMVKLDTNGSFPDMLKKVIDANLPDYIAMDIKAPLDFSLYSKSAGFQNEEMLKAVKKSIKLIMESNIDYEFRTTVVPTLHSEEDIKRIAAYIQGAPKYALQNFAPGGDLLNPKFKEIKPYTEEELGRIQEAVSSYVGECIVRGV